MAGFLYFRPGLTAKPDAAELTTLGLSEAFTRPPASRDCFRGPTGTGGIVLGDPERMGDEQIGYYPDRQHWEPVERAGGDPAVLLGWYRDNRPTPADLARREQVQGPLVRLRDGSEWMIPLVQQWNTSAEAPQCLLARPVKRRAVDGKWVMGDVVPTYRALWEAAKSYWQILLDIIQGAGPDATGGHFEFNGLHDFACALLAVNYAITPDEASALELFWSDGDAARLCEAAVDFPTFCDWLQKKSAAGIAGASSSPGPAAEPPATDLRSLT